MQIVTIHNNESFITNINNIQSYSKNNLKHSKSREKYFGKYNNQSKKNLFKYNNRNSFHSLSPNQNRNNNLNKNKYKNDPFRAASKHKTNFGYVYSVGGIPCRLDFIGNMKLRWSIPPKEIDYDPLLEICFEGLLETEHPYNFIARECIKELLKEENSYDKVLPLLPKLLVHCRRALECNIEQVFLNAMDIVLLLSNLLKEKMNKYLYLILQPINKRSFKMKYKEKVFDLLRVIENNGGEGTYYLIKNKIPTYTSLL